MKKYFIVLFILFITLLSSCNNSILSNSSKLLSSSLSSYTKRYEDNKFLMELYSLEGTQKVIEKFNNKETFILVFEGTTCGHCKNFNEKVLNVYLNSKNGKEYQDDIYYYFSTDFISEIYSLVLSQKIDEAAQLANLYEKNIILPYYKPSYEEFEGYEYNSIVQLSEDLEFYAAETPSTLYVVNGEVMGFLYGDISMYNNYLLRFSETINAWKIAQNNFEQGKQMFHDVLASLD